MATRDYTITGASIVSDKDSFADLDFSFTAHPVTEDIVTKKDANAIRQSVKNILLTNHYERPFKPNFGSNLRGMLFEANDPLMGHRIKESIVNALSVLEPRIGRVAVDIVQRDNSVDVRVAYVIMGSASHQELEFSVSRVR
tara:strand:- start:1858 stop:2280 length:423 start_codon:yes stop_codon:yes gene_type:complete